MTVMTAMHPDETGAGNGGWRDLGVPSETGILGKLASVGAVSDSCASRFWTYSSAELRCLPKRTLHNLLSSSSLVLQSEDALLQLLMDIDSETYEFWHYIEISLLSDEGRSRYAQWLRFDRLTPDIWSKIVSHLQGVKVDEVRRRRFHRTDGCAGQSSILATVPAPLKQFEEKKWKLLYRGSSCGFRSCDFHRACDGHPNTVTVILTMNGNIFGGFTPIAWNSNEEWEADDSQRSFLFTVKDESGRPPTAFPIVNCEHAIQGNPSYGPMFGGGSDLWVANKSRTWQSTCKGSGHTYRNEQVGAFLGEPNFVVKEIEVFSIIS
jgi:hypothetical protein